MSWREERNHSSQKGQRGSSPTERGQPPRKTWSSPAFSVVLRTTDLNPPLYNDRLTKIPLLNKCSLIVLLGCTCQPIRHQLPNPDKKKKKTSQIRIRKLASRKRENRKNHTSIIIITQTNGKKKKKKAKEKAEDFRKPSNFFFLFFLSLSSEKPNPRNPAIEAAPFSLSQIESELSGFRKVAAKYILWFLHPHSLFAEMMIFPLFPVLSSPISAPESSIWSKCGWNLRFPRSISRSRACISRFGSGSASDMALFRKFFYRKPPDGLLEISDRVYGMAFEFDCLLLFFWGFFVVLFWFRENWMECLVNFMSFGCFSCDFVLILLHWCFC